MKISRYLTLAGALVCALALAAPAQAVLTAPETLTLDTRQGPKGNSTVLSSPAQTSDVLGTGTFYAFVVSGTWTAYSNTLWDPATRPNWVVICGTPEPNVTQDSPGSPAQTPAGQDAETIFARPWTPGNCGRLPTAYGPNTGFQSNIGGGFTKVVPNGGPYTAPRGDHTYTYLVQGANAPASFRLRDTNTADNNGVLTITVRPATTADCNGNQQCLDQANAPTPPDGTGVTGTGVTAQGGPPVTGQGPVQLPGNRQCVSRRRFRIRVRTRRGDPVIGATVRVNGRRVRISRISQGGRRRVTAVVDLRGLPKGRWTVSIQARTQEGRTLSGSRRYFTCTPKRRGSTPRL